MKKSQLVLAQLLLLNLAGCQDATKLLGEIKVTVKDSNPQITKVTVSGDQLIVKGSNLQNVQLAKIEGITNHQFEIESKSSDKLILNARNALSILVGQSLNLIVSNAQAAATFPISFELQNGQVQSVHLDDMGASSGQVLRFNGTNWVPSTLSSSQVYAGTYNAATDSPNLSGMTAPAGTYYIVTASGTQNLGSGAITLDAGDWVVSDGIGWDRVAIGGVTVSNFNGRTGVVVPLNGDYSWSMLQKTSGKLSGSKIQEIADVDVTGIQDGDILQWNNSSSQWEAAPYPTLSITAGSITGTDIANGSIDSAKISDGSITNADVSASAAIAQSKIANLTTDLAGKEPSIPTGTGLQYVRGNKTLGTLNTTVVPEGTNLYFTEGRVRATTLLGYTGTAAGPISPLDTIPQAIGKLESYVNSFSSASGDYVLLDGTSAMGGNLNLNSHRITNVTDPTAAQDAATKSYVDGVASPWVKSGANLSYTAGRVGIGNSSPTEALDVGGNITVSGGVRYQSNTPNYIELKAPAGLASTFGFVLPPTVGAPNQLLMTDGSGNLSWTTPGAATPSGSAGGDLSGTYPNPTITGLAATKIGSGSVDNTELDYLDGVTSNIQTQLTGKLGTGSTFSGDVSGAYNATSVDRIKGSPIALTSVTNGNVLRFNGTNWVNAMLGTSDITSGVLPVSRGGTNLGSLSGDRIMLSTPTGLVEAPALSNGQILIGSTGSTPVAATLTAGTGVSITNSAGGITINATGSGGTVTNVTGTAPISVATGTSTPVVSISQASTSTNGYVSSSDWNTFNNKQDPLSSGAVINGVTYPANSTLPLQVTLAPVNLTDVVNLQALNTAISGIPASQWAVNGTHISNNNSGNVGIGTSTPTEKLDIAGKVISTGGTNNNGYFIGSGTTYGMYEFVNTLKLQSGYSVLNLTNNNTPGSEIFRLEAYNGSAVNVMSADNNGNVGIGTITPGTKLEVAGQVKITGGTPGAGKVLTSDASGLATWQTPASGIGGSGTTNTIPMFSGASTLANSPITVTGGNVYVGGAPTFPSLFSIKSSSPTLSLEDSDSSGATATGSIFFRDSTGSAYGSLGDSTTANSDIVLQATTGAISFMNLASQPILFSTSGTEKMRVDSAGNLGIGTSTPGAKLEVAGQVKITGGSPGAGKVLTSDAAGLASWTTIAPGGVTSVSGTAPVTVTGTTSPVVSMAAATTSVDGYLTSADWNTFNSKLGTSTTLSGDVSGTYNATSVDKIKGSPIALTSVATGNVLRFNGTNWVNAMLGVSDITSGVLPVARGGTNLGSLTGNRIMLSTSTALVEAPAMTNGQLLIGSTGVAPVAATLTAGTGVTITNSAGGITINATGSGGTVTNVTGTAPISVATGTSTPVISMSQANTSTNGYLSSTDWNTFNNKQAALSSGATINNVIYPATSVQNLQVSNAPANLTDVVNKQYVDGFGQWGTSSGNVYRTSGNVGIGTSTPDSALTINSSNIKTTLRLMAMPGGGGYLSARGNTSHLDVFGGYEYDLTAGNYKARASASAGIEFEGIMKFFTNTGLTDGNTFTPTERMRIDTAGNVGIGTTIPGAKLEVAGQVKITGGTPGAGKVLTSDAAGLATWQTPAGGSGDFMKDGSVAMTGPLKLANGSAAAPAITFSSEPTTGFFYSSPSDIKWVQGGTNRFNFGTSIVASTSGGGGLNSGMGTASYPAFFFQGDGDTGMYTPSAGSNVIAFTTAGVERLRIDSAGNVGIGATSSGAKLEVAGQVKITGGTPGAGKVLTSDAAGLASWQTPGGSDLSSGPTINGIVYPANGTQTLQIPLAPFSSTDAVNKQYVDSFGQWGLTSGNAHRTTGNVGIGTATPGTNTKLNVVGQMTTSSGSITDGAVDFSLGNAITTTFDCGSAISFANMRDGGAYTLAVTGSGTTQCTFSTSTTGDGAATVSYKFVPANAARTASTHTLYSFQRIGTVVYVSWISGF